MPKTTQPPKPKKLPTEPLFRAVPITPEATSEQVGDVADKIT